MRLSMPPPGAAVQLPSRSRDVPAFLDLSPGLDPAAAAEVVGAARRIPPADASLLQAAGVRVRVLDAERVDTTLLGATDVRRADRDGRWRPVDVRIAGSRAAGGPDPGPGYVLLHEVGHAVSVLRSQDRSEAAAEAYASALLPPPAGPRSQGAAAPLAGAADGSTPVLAVALALLGVALLL